MPSPADVRNILHEEAVEIREREKKVDPVIIRGLGSDVVSSQKFNEVVSFPLGAGKSITLEEIVLIKPDMPS